MSPNEISIFQFHLHLELMKHAVKTAFDYHSKVTYFPAVTNVIILLIIKDINNYFYILKINKINAVLSLLMSL